MNTGGVFHTNILLHDHGPITERHILEPGEGVDAGVNPPDRGEVARGLFIERGGDAGDLRKINIGCFRNESELTDKVWHWVPHYPLRLRPAEVLRKAVT